MVSFIRLTGAKSFHSENFREKFKIYFIYLIIIYFSVEFVHKSCRTLLIKSRILSNSVNNLHGEIGKKNILLSYFHYKIIFFVFIRLFRKKNNENGNDLNTIKY